MFTTSRVSVWDSVEKLETCYNSADNLGIYLSSTYQSDIFGKIFFLNMAFILEQGYKKGKLQSFIIFNDHFFFLYYWRLNPEASL